jgi:DNA-binding IclR family transcriptional regulator
MSSVTVSLGPVETQFAYSDSIVIRTRISIISRSYVYKDVKGPMGISDSGDGGKRVSSVERAFDVVEVLRTNGPMRIDDVAEALDISSSTAHVHLKTLESVGYAIREAEGYRLGFRFLRNGIGVRQQSSVYQTTRPEVDGLAEETGEVANLGVEEEGKRVILYQAEGTEAVYDNAPTGEYTNMHWTALGKSILAHLPEAYVEDVIAAHGLPSRQENTITDRDHLVEELARVRDRKYAIEDEERRAGIRSVAVPILVDDSVVGALSVSGPKERLDDRRIDDELLPALRNRVNVVEVRYAYE